MGVKALEHQNTYPANVRSSKYMFYSEIDHFKTGLSLCLLQLEVSHDSNLRRVTILTEKGWHSLLPSIYRIRVCYTVDDLSDATIIVQHLRNSTVWLVKRTKLSINCEAKCIYQWNRNIMTIHSEMRTLCKTVEVLSTVIAEKSSDMKKCDHEIAKEEVPSSTHISSFEEKVEIHTCYDPDIHTRKTNPNPFLHDPEGRNRKTASLSFRSNRQVNDPAWSLRFALILLILICASTKAVNNIEFHLMSNPAYFGNNVTVYCRMNSSSDQAIKHMAWFVNVTRQVARNNHSFYPNEYQIEVKYENGYMNYYLIILRFAVADVNLQYRCDFGFDPHCETLQLDSQRFIALPEEGKIQNSLNNTGGNLKGFVQMMNVYPMPRCDIMYEGHNYINDVIEIPEQNHIFYDVTLALKENVKFTTCPGVLNITCLFGTRYIPILEYDIKSCDGNSGRDGEGKRNIILLLVVILCLLITPITLITLIIYRRRCRRSRGSRRDRNEHAYYSTNQSLMN